MKFILKKILVIILGSQVRRLWNRHGFKIIGVVGSIGKTSTKLAIAKVLESEKRVRYEEGNYNDIVSVPLVVFGHKMPSLWNVFSWVGIILKNEAQIYGKYPFDIVVLELGTDGPNQISQFRRYLHLDVAVITAIAPEHMEFFGTLEKVADEEWSVSYFSNVIFANKDLCKIVPENVDHKKVVFYGKDFGSVYKIENVKKAGDNFEFEISYKGGKMTDLSYKSVSEVQLYSICVAAAVGRYFEVSPANIKESVKNIKSFSGRMQRLVGIKGSVIIDDTYNASPDAVRIALDTLYLYPQKQKIAILGMMNELGEISEGEHRKIGEYCNPKFLNLVVTVGRDANAFLAPAARKRGCEVYEAKNSIDAGNFVAGKIGDDAVVLAKGSQNGVFTEEALKPLLKNKADFSKLVRQDRNWLKKKELTFK